MKSSPARSVAASEGHVKLQVQVRRGIMTKVQSLQTPWYDKTVKALQLAGMGESTKECSSMCLSENGLFLNTSRRKKKAAAVEVL